MRENLTKEHELLKTLYEALVKSGDDINVNTDLKRSIRQVIYPNHETGDMSYLCGKDYCKCCQ